MIHFIKTLLFTFLCVIGFYYLVGSFIAWDFNPLNWWIFTSVFGRIIGILLVGLAFSAAVKVYEDF